MNQFLTATALSTCMLVACVISADVAVAAVDWMDDDWTRRIEFTAEPSLIEGTGTFSEFTLLLELDATHFGPVFAHADSSGSDLVVTAGDGVSVLELELVSYDPVQQLAELWFKAASLSDADNVFYLYYDNDAETPQAAAFRASAPGAAWSTDHVAVYHYAEDPSLGTLKDWGPNANDAVAAVTSSPVGPGWTPSNLVDAAIGKGWEYDGIDLYTYVTGVVSSDSSFTISAWHSNASPIDSGSQSFSGASGAWALSFQRTGGQPRANIDTGNGFITWTPEIPEGELHHYAWSCDADADTVRFYLDGEEQNIYLRYTHNGNQGSVYTGESIAGRNGIAGPSYFNSLDLSDGIVDEYRIFAGARSPEWLKTEYRNQSDPSTFYVVGDEELVRPVGIGESSLANAFGKVSVWPNPFRGVANISVETDLTDVTVGVYDVKGRLVRTLRRPNSVTDGFLGFLWNGKDSRGTHVSNGIYYFRVHDGRAAASSKAVMVR